MSCACVGVSFFHMIVYLFVMLELLVRRGWETVTLEPTLNFVVQLVINDNLFDNVAFTAIHSKILNFSLCT